MLLHAFLVGMCYSLRSIDQYFQFNLLFESWIGNFPKTLLLVSQAKIQYARDGKRLDLLMLLFTNIGNELYCYYNEFQTIYSINYVTMVRVNSSLVKAPLQYIENFQSPAFNARKDFGATPFNIFIPPPRHNKCTFPKQAEVLPYQFKPEVGGETSNLSEESDSDQGSDLSSSDKEIDHEFERVNVWHLQTLSWCKCGYCTTKAIECFCCHKKALEYDEYDVLLEQTESLG